jgi:cysteine-rich repeat protein
VCATVCGDGIPAGNEDCDDGNTTDGDGCGSGCWQEYGYACSGAPSVCLPLCGDGYKTNAEACDDGNLVGGDGCSVTCAVEPGYACKGGLGSTSECAPICGDGLLTGNEACDDHNAVNGDGCSKSCAVEAGFTCAGAPSVCTTTCGDGLRAGAETCDDGNLVDGDGCSAVCHAEPGWEIEPNDTVDDANAFATVALSGVVHARVNAFADNDYFLFTVPPGSTADLLAETHDGLVSTCTTDIDTVIYVYDANGVQLGYDDQGGVGGCSLINVYGLVPGDYYVQVRPYSGGATYDYSLQLTPTFYLCGDGNLDAGEQCDDGNTVNGDGCSASCRLEIFNETEPNDTCATASGPTVIPPGPDGVLVGGQITPATEQDWFSFVVPAYADVRFETFDTYGPGTCELGVDTVIQVYKPSCTPQGAAVDQLGINGCSLIDPAVDPQTQHLAPGTYKVRVTSYQGGSTFAYTLQARFAALCGDGVVEGSEQCDGGLGCGADCRPVPKCGNGVREAGEQCDDGNTAAGDGCGATCQWEKTAEVEPNNTPAAADAALPVITGSVNLGGSINAIGDVDLYKLHAATQRTVRFEIFDNTGVDCIAMPAMTLTLLDSTGAEIRRDTPPSDFTGSGIGVCPALVFDLAPGDYYLQAARLSFGTVPSYFLQIKYETDNGAKVEPNDTMAQATPDPGRDTAIFGAHVAMNLDWYAITIPPGQPLSLRAEIVEGDALLSCEADEIDSELSLFDDQGNQLVFDDDDGRGYCSLIDGTGATPLHPQAHNLPPGTYYLQVGEDISSDFNYKLAVTLR